MRRKLALTAIVTLACTTQAFAHTQGGPAHDFGHGVLHPLSGIDHAAAMAAVGLWASQLGGRALWLLPLTFVAAMSAGGFLLQSAGVVLAHETIIVASVILLGGLVALRIRVPLIAAIGMTGAFAAFHGVAHWAETPADASGVSYGAGFVIATAALHGLGVFTGLQLAQWVQSRAVQGLGGAVAITGVVLSVV